MQPACRFIAVLSRLARFRDAASANALCVHLEVKTADDLFGPGAKEGTIPTDLEQSTGLERLEVLGKMEGVDIFDMRPLDASRQGMTNMFRTSAAGGHEF